MITKNMANREIFWGLSAVCAWCEHWHAGKDRIGRSDAVTCGVDGCGGPKVGKGFPKYKGPMDGHLAAFCFICGEDADGAVEIGGRMLGFCSLEKPRGVKCVDQLRDILSRQNVLVKELLLPTVGSGIDG